MLPEMEISFEGTKEFFKELEAYTDKVERAVEKALYREGEELMAESKPLVPVDEGILRASGFVELPVTVDGETEVKVGFGGPAGIGNQGATNTEDVGYAVIQHEDLTFHHTTGQAKFLEVPLNRRKSGYSERIAERIRANLK